MRTVKAKAKTGEASVKRHSELHSQPEFVLHFEVGNIEHKRSRSSMKWSEAKVEGKVPAARGGHAGVSFGNSCYYFGGADR